MVAALALLFAHQGSTITFESTAITVQGFCKELSRQTGKKFVAWDAVQGDLLAIHLDAAPIEGVLKQLQFVERAKLDFDGTTNNVRPDITVRTKYRADWMADHIKAIKSIQNHLRNLVRDKPLDGQQSQEIVNTISALYTKQDAQYEAKNYTALNQTSQQIQDQQLRLPGGNAMLRLFLAIPPEELAAIPITEDGVWSTSPTQVESPWRLDSTPILQGLAADQSVWAEASTKFTADRADYLAGLTPTTSKPTALLRLEVFPDIVGLSEMTLTAFDADGKKSFSISQGFDGEAMQPSVAPLVHSLDFNPVIVSIPTETQRLTQLWCGYPSESEMTTWANDQALKEIYFNPEKYDPVGETFGRVMVEIAKARKEQLMAAEPAIFARKFPIDAIVKGKLSDRALEEAYFENGAKYRSVLFANDGSWITVRPGFDLIWADATWEFSRPALGKLLRSARDTQVITLMDTAKFAAETNSRRSLVTPMRLLPFFEPGVSGLALLRGDAPWYIKAFLGSLDEMQIAIAQQPRGLSLSGCTPHQLDILAYRFREKRFLCQGQSDVWRSYATDGLPTGLPGGGVLHLSLDTGTTIRARYRRDGGYFFDTYGSATQLADRLSGLGTSGPESTLHLVGLVPQVRQSYVFTFVFPDEVTTAETLNDYRPAGKEVKTVEELDEPLRSEVKAAIEKALKK